jgi:hypothetical protein
VWATAKEIAMTMKQFVNAIHEAWNKDIFLSMVAIHSVRCRMYAGELYFYVKLQDGTTTSVYTTEEGEIVFF